MIESKVIIVGGGPAGSSCARELVRLGGECLIIDKKRFPRFKLCAGWIQPDLLEELHIDPGSYPFSLTFFDHFRVHVFGKQFTPAVRQYAIRRYQFDQWLLSHCGAPVYTHAVKNIKKDNSGYTIDDLFHCRYLIGAGGTHCPVYRSFFKKKHPRRGDKLIATLEQEVACKFNDPECRLWFLIDNLPGYAWYVPKEGGYVNIGIGGYLHKIRDRGKSIDEYWQRFMQELQRFDLMPDVDLDPKGAVYYIRNNLRSVQNGKAFIIGDAAGLATKDMGEGIGPAVESGMLVARSIALGVPLDFRSIRKNSFSKWWLLSRFGPALVKSRFF
ncbi:NAD(P)/FAD-dependent oxidoreductase [candidate division KSB1 bacterium]|nr:NAD(P)/FAD-dependent oxidoreductase [candidate division KSB1 bacterium]